AMEVHARLARERQRVEERVHQIGLAATDAAPEIEASHRGPVHPLAEQATLRRMREQIVIDLLQRIDCLLLRRIGDEAFALQIALVALLRRRRLRHRAMPSGSPQICRTSARASSRSALTTSRSVLPRGASGARISMVIGLHAGSFWP